MVKFFRIISREIKFTGKVLVLFVHLNYTTTPLEVLFNYIINYIIQKYF